MSDPVLKMSSCHTGIFLERIKRFTVRIRHQQEEILAHTNNTGSMRGVLSEKAPVLFSESDAPGRKLRYSLEAVWTGCWTGVNTQTPNRFLEAAFVQGKLPFAAHYTILKREVPYGASRIDGRFSAPGMPDLWVECKNVSLVEHGSALFPDAPSTRARKHLLELAEIVASGQRAAMLFVVQRNDCQAVAPAAAIDPGYAQIFSEVTRHGVESYACFLNVTQRGIFVGQWLPVLSA